MGNCILSQRGRSHSNDGENSAQSPTIASVHIKSQPLKSDLLKWKSEVPISVSQLAKKREEFWQISPIFEGRKEVWDALRAAAIAIESNDLSLAQAILDGASIVIPDGTLQEAYDQLGNRYIVPMFCLSLPSNLLPDDEIADTSASSEANLSNDNTLGVGFGDSKIYVLRLRINARGDEKELSFRSQDTIAFAKMRLDRMLGESCENPGKRQRWYYGGVKLEDKLLIKNMNIPQGHVIQVIFNE